MYTVATAATTAVKPQALDGVDIPSRGLVNLPLFVQGAKAWVFDMESRARVYLDLKHLTPHPSLPKHWVYDSKNSPTKSVLKKYKVTINVNGHVDSYELQAPTEGSAKARIVSKTARKLNCSEAHVYMLLRQGKNSLTIEELK